MKREHKSRIAAGHTLLLSPITNSVVSPTHRCLGPPPWTARTRAMTWRLRLREPLMIPDLQRRVLRRVVEQR